MNLFLHCGYHKTGSSFLQTLFSRNRSYLKNNGYHFPVSTREYDMQLGNISPGNGPELATALKNNDYEKSQALIGGYVSSAQKEGCDSILLSSENFFHAFEKRQAVECLVKSAEMSNIEQIHALLYFRDPVSHALSTFKHRAKKGTIPDFSKWLRSEYETMSLIEKFIEYHDQFPVQWVCRKYKSDSLHMAKSAFADWLGLKTPEIPDDDRVNTSLTLSELMCIQAVGEKRPNLIPFVRQAFSNLSHMEKAEDRELTRKYSMMASEVLSGYRELINNVNSLLPVDEALTIRPAEIESNTSARDNIVLTNKQVMALADAAETGVKSEQIINKSRALIAKAIEKLNRKVKTFGA